MISNECLKKKEREHKHFIKQENYRVKVEVGPIPESKGQDDPLLLLCCPLATENY